MRILVNCLKIVFLLMIWYHYFWRQRFKLIFLFFKVLVWLREILENFICLNNITCCTVWGRKEKKKKQIEDKKVVFFWILSYNQILPTWKWHDRVVHILFNFISIFFVRSLFFFFFCGGESREGNSFSLAITKSARIWYCFGTVAYRVY